MGMDLRDKMLAVIADVNAQIVERAELVELIAIALLTRKNLFLLGQPGQAKSYAINAFRNRILGAKQFERLLSKQTDEEQLFGRIDLSSLIPGTVPEALLRDDPVYQELRRSLEQALHNLAKSPNLKEAQDQVEELTVRMETYRKAVAALHRQEPMVITAGKIPEAELVFLDEIFKANDGVLNSLLTALNERKYTNEGNTYPIPVISFFAASNELPNFNDPQEKILQALYDRLELKYMTADIGEKANRQAILRDKQTGRHGQIGATITLEELLRMQEQVAAVSVPDAINDLADDALCELRKTVRVSDRKFLSYYPLAQAKAWLSGHKTVEPSDLLVLIHYFWDSPSDYPLVMSTMTRMCLDPIQDKANDLLAMAKEAADQFNEDVQGGTDKRKALRKLRDELIRLYGGYDELKNKARTDHEKAVSADLLAALENYSRKAHEAAGFTYAPLEELATLQ